MFKTVNIDFVSTSPNTKAQDNESKKRASQIAVDCPAFFSCIFKIGGHLFGADIPKDKILLRYRISGSKAKILSPLSKKQVLYLVAFNKLSDLGTAEKLQKYYSGKYSISNDGQAIEYLVAQVRHLKFDHNGKMSPSGECGGREFKFFDFDKTTGTPSATIKR